MPSFKPKTASLWKIHLTITKCRNKNHNICDRHHITSNGHRPVTTAHMVEKPELGTGWIWIYKLSLYKDFGYLTVKPTEFFTIYQRPLLQNAKQE